MENYSWKVTFNLPNNEKEVVKTSVEDTNTKSDLSDINFTFQDLTEESKQFENMIDYMNKWNELIRRGEINEKR